MTSGPSVGTITLTFAGVMPKEIQILRPNNNGLPDCDYDEWTPSDGIPGNQYLMVNEIICDNDISYILYDDNATPGRQFFDIDSVSLPTDNIIDYVRILAIVRHYIAFENTYLANWIPPYGGTQQCGYWYGTKNGYFKLGLTQDNCISIVSQSFLLHYYQNIKCTHIPTYDTETYYAIYYDLPLNPNTGLSWEETDLDDTFIGIEGLPADIYGYAVWCARFGHDLEYIKWYSVSSPTYSNYIDGNNMTYSLKTNYVGIYVDPNYALHPLLFGVDESSPTLLYHELQGNSTDDRIFEIGVIFEHIYAYIHDVKYKFILEYNGEKHYSPEYTIIAGGSANSSQIAYGQLVNTYATSTMSFNNLKTAGLIKFGVLVTNLPVGAYITFDDGYPYFWSKDYVSKLKCSQMALNVIYHEAPPTPCRLPKPVDVQVNGEYEATGLNFWSGNREVYSLGRNSKQLLLSGLMWDGCTDRTTPCEDLIHCIRTLAKYKKPVTLTGMRYASMNTNFNILSFDWKQIQEKPNTYEWRLEVEFCA